MLKNDVLRCQNELEENKKLLKTRNLIHMDSQIENTDLQKQIETYRKIINEYTNNNISK